jgi:hypothetical protein
MFVKKKRSLVLSAQLSVVPGAIRVPMHPRRPYVEEIKKLISSILR